MENVLGGPRSDVDGTFRVFLDFSRVFSRFFGFSLENPRVLCDSPATEIWTRFRRFTSVKLVGLLVTFWYIFYFDKDFHQLFDSPLKIDTRRAQLVVFLHNPVLILATQHNL